MAGGSVPGLGEMCVEFVSGSSDFPCLLKNHLQNFNSISRVSPYCESHSIISSLNYVLYKFTNFLIFIIYLFSTATPRPGTCPSQLKPPSGLCASDSDECMFDWDCEGTTKKCCSNNCFKECVEPALSAAIRGINLEQEF